MPHLTEEERARSEAVVQQRFGSTQGVVNVGARMLAKMGFGAAEGSRGGLGRNEHVRYFDPLFHHPILHISNQSCTFTTSFHAAYTENP